MRIYNTRRDTLTQLLDEIRAGNKRHLLVIEESYLRLTRYHPKSMQMHEECNTLIGVYDKRVSRKQLKEDIEYGLQQARGHMQVRSAGDIPDFCGVPFGGIAVHGVNLWR